MIEPFYVVPCAVESGQNAFEKPWHIEAFKWWADLRIEWTISNIMSGNLASI